MGMQEEYPKFPLLQATIIFDIDFIVLINLPYKADIIAKYN
jgi:hypothetical protein